MLSWFVDLGDGLLPVVALKKLLVYFILNFHDNDSMILKSNPGKLYILARVPWIFAALRTFKAIKFS